jgi:hypothetical protein
METDSDSSFSSDGSINAEEGTLLMVDSDTSPFSVLTPDTVEALLGEDSGRTPSPVWTPDTFLFENSSSVVSLENSTSVDFPDSFYASGN